MALAQVIFMLAPSIEGLTLSIVWVPVGFPTPPGLQPGSTHTFQLVPLAPAGGKSSIPLLGCGVPAVVTVAPSWYDIASPAQSGLSSPTSVEVARLSCIPCEQTVCPFGKLESIVESRIRKLLACTLSVCGMTIPLAAV